MNEITIVYFVQAASFALTIALLLGWLPAWKAKSKGEGPFLLQFYVVCIGLSAIMLILGNPQFASNHFLRDTLLCGDSSPYAAISKLFGGERRGMSYQAGAYIMAQVDGVRIVALVYCGMAIWCWRKLFHKQAIK